MAKEVLQPMKKRHTKLSQQQQQQQQSKKKLHQKGSENFQQKNNEEKEIKSNKKMHASKKKVSFVGVTDETNESEKGNNLLMNRTNGNSNLPLVSALKSSARTIPKEQKNNHNNVANKSLLGAVDNQNEEEEESKRKKLIHYEGSSEEEHSDDYGNDSDSELENADDDDDYRNVSEDDLSEEINSDMDHDEFISDNDEEQEEEDEDEESSNPFVQSKKHHTPLSYPVLCLRFLPQEFQEPQLYKFLNQFGANVLNCFCVRSKRTHQSKGIAYVQMDQTDVLPTLVEECHGMMLGNRAIQARIVNLHRAMPTKENVTRRRNLAYAYKTRGVPLKRHNVLYKSPIALLIKAARNEQANNAHLKRLGIDYETDFFTSQLTQMPQEAITHKVRGLKLPFAIKVDKSKIKTKNGITKEEKSNITKKAISKKNNNNNNNDNNKEKKKMMLMNKKKNMKNNMSAKRSLYKDKHVKANSRTHNKSNSYSKIIHKMQRSSVKKNNATN